MVEPVLYGEPGSTWWPLAWGPGLAMVGVVLDLTSGESVQVLLWLPVAVLFTLVSAVWVATRRKTRSLSLTPTTLRQGREELAVAEIVDVGAAGPAMGAVVLGGGWLVPNGTDGVPLRLRDGRSVLAWARDSDELVASLCQLLGIDPPGDRADDAGPGPAERDPGPRGPGSAGPGSDGPGSGGSGSEPGADAG